MEEINNNNTYEEGKEEKTEQRELKENQIDAKKDNLDEEVLAIENQKIDPLRKSSIRKKIEDAQNYYKKKK